MTAGLLSQRLRSAGGPVSASSGRSRTKEVGVPVARDGGREGVRSIGQDVEDGWVVLAECLLIVNLVTKYYPSANLNYRAQQPRGSSSRSSTSKDMHTPAEDAEKTLNIAE
ncbi:unnamed protein product [Cyclocybe aegerita]|uniref:Uncharacterized protein n=1 Tax=Cyclocybe aegerita TaxID=1973307 RepID=A0A8S0VWG9_CYCAE|nr:unnamed protein product [Cyclocybe aegerita]